MKNKLFPDKYLLLTIIALVVIGFFAVHNTSTVYGTKDDIFSGYIAILIISSIFAIIIMFMPSITILLDKIVVILLVTTLILLIMVLLIGVRAGNARRWIDVGSFTLQPSEIAKLTIVVYLSSVLSKKGKKLNELTNGFMPPLAVLFVMSILIALEPDFSTAVFFSLIGLIIFIYAGTPIKFVILVGICLLVLSIFLVSSNQYMYERIERFDFSGKSGYQINQAIITFSRSGIRGMPLDELIQSPIHLPAGITDFILASVAQNLGLFGTASIVLLFLFFMIRGMIIAYRIDDLFSKYLAFSIVIAITTQAYINMMVAVSLMPITGMTLPFISYGRNSMFVSMIMAAILLNISRQAVKK